MKNLSSCGILIRNTRPEDFDSIIRLCRRVYPSSPPWRIEQLASHLELFPEGQFVAVDEMGRVAGMAASLIIHWEDYRFDSSWRDFTDAGMFTNHDPVYGRTLYGAEVMVDPTDRGQGVGSRLYLARRRLAERLSLRRIRAASRLRGYHRFAQEMRVRDYVRHVVDGDIRDPTLSFQLKQGFAVLDVVSGYLRHDPESLGYAALIECRDRQTQNLRKRGDGLHAETLCQIAR